MKRRAIIPVFVFAGAILLLVGAITLLFVGQASTDKRVTRLEILNRTFLPCADREAVKCALETQRVIRALTVAERRELASLLAPYLSGKHGRVLVVNRTVLQRVYERGSRGAAGSNGTDGAQGARGAQGQQGSQGSRGPQGARGPRGPAGPPGPPGPAGKIIRIVCHRLPVC